MQECNKSKCHTCMTPRAYINILWNPLGPTSSISCNTAVVINPQNHVWYVYINEIRNYDLGNIFLPGSTRGWGRNTYAEERRPKHHDHSPSLQQRFVAHNNALVKAFQEAVNPFHENSDEVVIIDTRYVMTDNVARIVMSAHPGQKQRADFVAHRLHSTALAFHALIKINKIHLPGNRHKNRNISKYVSSTKKDTHLLGQLYMIVYVREGTSYRLFEVENSDCPPSLSKHGVLRIAQKSVLLPWWEGDNLSEFD